MSVGMDREHVVLTVADNGPGIPESDRDSIFEAYGRSHRFQGRPGSIGLGLTVSRYLAEAMGGSLTYDRVEEESRFILRLPLYQHHLESLTEPQ
jgi:signal transduction histidine kinase